jgi:hypothetical protein
MIEGLGPVAVARLEKALQSDNETVALTAAREILSRVAPVPKSGSLQVSVEHSATPHLTALVGLAAAAAHRVQSHPMIDENATEILEAMPRLTNDAHSRVGPEGPVGPDVDADAQ